MTDTLPPKPEARPDKVSLWRYMQLFRKDILSAQPAKLYRAWMAEFRTPFFRSYLTKDRLDMIAAGDAPDDLATKILTTKDPVTGDTLSLDEMVDQVAIFFLAGHETSASALAWALYCWRNTRTGRPSWLQKGRPMMGRLQISPVFKTPATFFVKHCVFIHLYR